MSAERDRSQRFSFLFGNREINSLCDVAGISNETIQREEIKKNLEKLLKLREKLNLNEKRRK